MTLKVLYLDIDSLRPDHLGCYGYGRPTAPHIDRLAAQGMRFDRCYTSDSPCMPSRAALFSGVPGIQNGVVTHGPRGQVLYPHGPTLPGALRAAGVRTGVVSTFGRHPSPWFLVGWDEVHDPTGWGFQQVPGSAITERALGFIERHAAEDFYLHVHFWDVHGWHDAPEGCLAAVSAAGTGTLPALPTEEQVQSHQGMAAWHCARLAGVRDRSDVEAMYDGYDAEIRYVDHHIGQILQRLEDLGILEDTLVLLSADHGQEFGEHGVYFEHGSVYEGTAHVPLIARYPRWIRSGRADEGLIYQLDIASTVLEAFGVAVPKQWESRSLGPRLRGEATDARPYLVCGHGLYMAQRAVVQGPWKLVRTLHAGHWDVPPTELFAPLEDPWEQVNLAAEYPEVVRELEGRLLEWEYAHPSPNGVDPMRVNAALGPQGIVGGGARQLDRLRQMKAGQVAPRPSSARKPEVDVAWSGSW